MNEKDIEQIVSDKVDEIKDDFFSADIRDLVWRICNLSMQAYIRDNAWQSDIKEYVLAEVRELIRVEIIKNITKESICEAAADQIALAVGASLRELKELKQDIMSGQIEKIFYEEGCRPSLKIAQIFERLFEMEKDIQELKKIKQENDNDNK